MWYRVITGLRETFQSIADRFELPVAKLVEFNFPGSVVNGQIVPSAVNWYLNNHFGFHCPVGPDRKSRIFKGKETIAIPYKTPVRIDKATAKINRAPLVMQDEPKAISRKFSGEWKMPTRPIGMFLFQAKLSVEGDIVPKGPIKISVTTEQVKLGIEQQLGDDLKAVAGFKLDKKIGEALAKAASGKDGTIAKALIAPLELQLKQKCKIFRLIPAEIGVEFSETPITLALYIEREVPLSGVEATIKYSLKATLYFGFAGTGLAPAVGVAGTVALIALTASITNGARERGNREAIVDQYVAGAVDPMFGGSRPPPVTPVFQEAYALGKSNTLYYIRQFLPNIAPPKPGDDRRFRDEVLNGLKPKFGSDRNIRDAIERVVKADFLRQLGS